MESVGCFLSNCFTVKETSWLRFCMSRTPVVTLSCSSLSVSGLGFGFMSGAFSVVNILADSVGPGTVGIHGDSQHYFLSSGTNLYLVD